MRTIFWAGFGAFLVDQISKYVVIHIWGLRAGNPIDVLPPYLNFIYGENCGINFGIFGDCSELGRWSLIGLALLICAAVLIWVWRNPLGRIGCISAGILAGGALANVVDRMIYGYVIDFLSNSCCGYTNPFVYNLADVFIFAGAIGLIVFTPDQKSPRMKAAKKGK